MIDTTELSTMDDSPRPPAWLVAVLLLVAALACWGIIYLLGLILGLI